MVPEQEYYKFKAEHTLSKIKRGSLAQGFDEFGIKLILHEHNKNNPNSNPILYVEFDRQDIETVLSRIIENNGPGQLAHHQIVTKSGGHYNAIDIHVKPNGTADLMVIDAANDFRMMALMNALSAMSNVNMIYYSAGKTDRHNLQKANHGCPVFAVSHALALQQVDTDKFLEDPRVEIQLPNKESDKYCMIPWEYFPVEFYKTVQSSTLWENYIKFRSEHFQEALDDYSVYREKMHVRACQLDENSVSRKGDIIPAVLEEITESARAYVATASNKELMKLALDDTKVGDLLKNIYDSLKRIIETKDWSTMTRNGMMPENITKMKRIIDNDDLNIYDKLLQIKALTGSVHRSDSFFSTLANLASGRDSFTNELYGILKLLDFSALRGLERIEKALQILEQNAPDVRAAAKGRGNQ